MRNRLDPHPAREDRIAIPTIWVAVGMSLVLHAALLFGGLPKMSLLPFEDDKRGTPSGALNARLRPVTPPALADAAPRASHLRPVIASPSQAAEPRATARQSLPPQPVSPPSVLAVPGPSPLLAPTPSADAARPQGGDDLASFVEVRRRAREAASGQTASTISAGVTGRSAARPVESEQERQNRIVAANLGIDRPPSFGADPRSGGGVFQIQRIGFADAEFIFYGWNKEIKRNSQQLVEVRRGSNPSTELAVVRRIIAIIREYESGDFQWQSRSQRREFTLSSRLADTAALEEFLMREFFPPPPAR